MALENEEAIDLSDSEEEESQDELPTEKNEAHTQSQNNEKKSETTKDNTTASQGKKSNVSDRIRRLRALQSRLGEARQKNKSAAIAEAEGNKSVAAFEVSNKKRVLKAERELENKEASLLGIDVERHRNLNVTAGDSEWYAKQKKHKRKHRETHGLGHDIPYQSYKKRLRDVSRSELQKEYEEKKLSKSDDLYRNVHDVTYGQGDQVEKKAVNRLVSAHEKQMKRRERFSRRREFFEEEDVTYIHEQNRQFNKKVERFFDRYTRETKANLERGTAL